MWHSVKELQEFAVSNGCKTGQTMLKLHTDNEDNKYVVWSGIWCYIQFMAESDSDACTQRSLFTQEHKSYNVDFDSLSSWNIHYKI